jgi:hypothetical protein
MKITGHEHIPGYNIPDLEVYVCGYYFQPCDRRSSLLMKEIVPILFHISPFKIVVVLSRVGIFSIFY